ncbi:MAG: bifunctional aspartate kinase/homoserine dehydrogenase I [Steroidobacteraceae bacterium]
MSSSGPAAWVVHKFGGSSVADSECFTRVAQIVESEPQRRKAVVLSAARGVTDSLLSLVHLAEARDRSYRETLAKLRDRHSGIARSVLSENSAQRYLAALQRDLHDIESVLQTIELTRSASRSVADLIAGFGEIWSTLLFRELMLERGRFGDKVLWLDARQIIVAEWQPLGPVISWVESQSKVTAAVSDDYDGLVIMTGFIAADSRGVQTTLGRNGSDFSASILGALLRASEIQIWTDVSGVLSADPRRVPDAEVIAELTYNEAMELAYFGAKVLHPQTMAPAIERRIPIRIRNTFAPQDRGTTISDRTDGGLTVKGITSIDDVALVNIEGAGMIGVPGTAHRLFGALREEGISVILISQGSSEHSICCAVPQREAKRAVEVVRLAFERELREGQIQDVGVDEDLSILAVVGDRMAGTPGVSAKVFTALGSAAVNVRAIAQGASERNISVVIDGRAGTRALRAVHSGFYLSAHTLSIGFIGPGTVGRVLLEQMRSQQQRLRDNAHLDLRVRALAGSRRMLLDERRIDLDSWRDQYTGSSLAMDFDTFTSHVHVDHLPHAAIIDCSASSEVAGQYERWLAAGIHVITPNKKANSAPYDYYQRLQASRRASGAHYLYEATVGAGLPIMQTLRDLRETGDEVRSIEGIFSGTLAYLFNVYDGAKAFSSIVVEAKNRGFTEPDPRDDLSGTDVARKLIILGREMGLRLELADVTVESLVPTELRDVPVDEFLAHLPQHDEAMRQRYAAARAKGRVLRYVGRLDASGQASVGLVEVPAGHALANIALTDNIVRFATARYCDNPLIVQGPGAGPEVTAGGVFADLLRLSAYLGARL